MYLYVYKICSMKLGVPYIMHSWWHDIDLNYIYSSHLKMLVLLCSNKTSAAHFWNLIWIEPGWLDENSTLRVSKIYRALCTTRSKDRLAIEKLSDKVMVKASRHIKNPDDHDDDKDVDKMVSLSGRVTLLTLLNLSRIYCIRTQAILTQLKLMFRHNLPHRLDLIWSQVEIIYLLYDMT